MLPETGRPAQFHRDFAASGQTLRVGRLFAPVACAELLEGGAVDQVTRRDGDATRWRCLPLKPDSPIR